MYIGHIHEKNEWCGGDGFFGKKIADKPKIWRKIQKIGGDNIPSIPRFSHVWLEMHSWEMHSALCSLCRWRCILGKHGEELHVHWFLWASKRPDIFPNHTGRMYLSNLQNVFVWIANVFVQIANYICLNCKLCFPCFPILVMVAKPKLNCVSTQALWEIW